MLTERRWRSFGSLAWSSTGRGGRGEGRGASSGFLLGFFLGFVRGLRLVDGCWVAREDGAGKARVGGSLSTLAGGAPQLRCFVLLLHVGAL